MTWTFEQKTGKLSHNGDYVATGYAGGNCGHNPEGKNNPDKQAIHNVGPIPRGWEIDHACHTAA